MPIQEAGGADRFYQGQPASTSAVLFTNSSQELKAVIREIVLAQNSTAATTISIQAGPNNSAASGNIIPTATSLAASTITIESLNVVLRPGESIWGVQSQATGITVTICGEYVA